MINPDNPNYANTPVSELRSSFDYQPIDRNTLPIVTIITPFFNTGEIFQETARSVFQQSFQQWEWIIINDCSTDPTSLIVLDEYRSCDPRVRVIDHEVNKGLGAARNTGFSHAQTAYVVQIDSDDLIEPTAIEKWYWFLESNQEIAFVKGYTVGFGAQGYLWEKGFHSGTAFLHENQVDATAMIRASVHQAVGGYDETARGGLEDWDFWMHAASLGYWGVTLPEYQDWYRRRATHVDRWELLQDDRMAEFRQRLRQRYPSLWAGKFPEARPRWHMPNESVPHQIPCENQLVKHKPRMLMILPWLTLGGADKFNCDFVQLLTERGWEITICTTLKGDHSWMSEFAYHTPDIFPLHHFLRLVDYPRFLRYLIKSRGVDVVFISNSELGYHLLPYLRAYAPETAFVDYTHMEEEYWKNGGYPRMAVEYQQLLDLNIVSSRHLKEWMVQRGGCAERIEICYTNIDTDKWDPDPLQRAKVRKEYGIGDDVPVLLYAGRMSAQKQPKVFAQTMLYLARKGLTFKTFVAGDGVDLPWLKQFVSTHHLQPYIIFLGAVPNARIHQLLSAADIFFLPSLMEGISLALYEAMAMKVVPVGAVVGGQDELVVPECGYLIERSNEETEARAYAEAIATLIRDPAKRQAMAQASRARVRDLFPLQEMADRMEELLKLAQERATLPTRASVAPEVGTTVATNAIEYARVEQLAEQLWAERQKLLARGPQAGEYKAYIKAKARETAKLVLRPIYQLAVRHGMWWLVPLRERIRARL